MLNTKQNPVFTCLAVWMERWNAMRKQWRRIYHEVVQVSLKPEENLPFPIESTLECAFYYKKRLEDILNKIMLSKPCEGMTDEEIMYKMRIVEELSKLEEDS